jgi:hypothetical protein
MGQGIRALNFGHDERLLAEAPGSGTQLFDIFCRFHKRLADRIHAVFQGKLKAFVVAGRKHTDAEINARQVEPFARAKFATHQHLAEDVLPRDRFHAELDQAVVQKQAVAALHHFGQRLEGHGGAGLVADDIAGGEGEVIARGKLDGFGVDLTQAHFGTGQIRHDGDPVAGEFLGLANAADDELMLGEVAVGKIQAGDVEAGVDQVHHHLRGAGGRPDGGNDFGLVVG